MSVINKMLRDLDNRQAPDSSALPARAGQDLRKGTASISMPYGSATGSGALRWFGVVLLGAVLFAAVGWWWQREYGTKPNVAVSAAASPVVVSLPQVVVQTPPVAMASAAQILPPVELVQAPVLEQVLPVQRATPATVVLRMDSTLSVKKEFEAERSAPPVAAQVLAPVKRPAAAQPTPVVLSVTVPATAPPPSDPSQIARRQQQAGKDAIAHAQSLWNAGSHEAAIELMTDVVATAERAAASTPTPGNSQVLVLLVRELARMQLAQSRPQAVWDLLNRLEPLLGNQADVWAVRANAAQRLGRHQDSVHAYMVALQSRPNEQRWLLGSAVSLAALGQTSSAADMAEKARAMGMVSKDVLAYLRQMGVAVND